MDDETRTSSGGAVPVSTGDAQVDRILATLDGLDSIAVDQQVGLYLELHDRLGAELNPELNPEQKLRRAGAHGAS